MVERKRPARRDLSPLIGRKVSCFFNGLRTGTVVAVPAAEVVTVAFLAPHGRHRLSVSEVRSVSWYGKALRVDEYLERRQAVKP